MLTPLFDSIEWCCQEAGSSLRFLFLPGYPCLAAKQGLHLDRQKDNRAVIFPVCCSPMTNSSGVWRRGFRTGTPSNDTNTLELCQPQAGYVHAPRLRTRGRNYNRVQARRCAGEAEPKGIRRPLSSSSYRVMHTMGGIGQPAPASRRQVCICDRVTQPQFQFLGHSEHTTLPLENRGRIVCSWSGGPPSFSVKGRRERESSSERNTRGIALYTIWCNMKKKV
jgi:hypothetical protein